MYYKRGIERDGFKPEYRTKHVLKKMYVLELKEDEDLTLEEVVTARAWVKIPRSEYLDFKKSRG